ncbi:MAG TPA: peptidoglycan DD-metalloendopeptidase family protein [Spirochaetota bacterium]|nr:peptidoglycan DD-metalloendopeptidase family protein [Spirochaetota bacterium]HPI89154.1 peptidoglycan DD-metalloendopeptidase family protein [Spirochaetota bacterium]HPR46851.1 peptidoglycan DD-metalloendopeptidase family protein [Spirochaetota bacterium]
MNDFKDKIIAIILLSACFIFFGNGPQTFAKEVDTVELDLENSLIIKEIEMESEPDSLESDQGSVIVDDSLNVYEYKEENVSDQPEKAYQRNRKDYMAELFKKDPRWHLTQYTIKHRDNLWGIARKFNISHRFIIDANNITDPDMLIPGTKLNVPNKIGIYHRVHRGDSIYCLSKKYRVSSEKIITQNRVNPRALAVGQMLFIPDARSMAHVVKKNKITDPEKSAVFQQFACTWPLKGKVTSGFGTRKDPFSGKKKFHCGIDISAPEGTPIHAAAEGRVIFSGWKNGYGKVIVLRHENSYISVYAHNYRNLVKKGDIIQNGQDIALSGKTGAVTGAHLHFEIRKYITPLNPLRFLH